MPRLGRRGHRRLRFLPAGLFLTLLTIWQFSNHLFPGRHHFFPLCTFDFHYQYLVVSGLVTDGTLPLWNPFSHAGEPLYLTHAHDATYSPAIFLISLLARLFPKTSFLRLFSIVHTAAMLLCAFATFAFLQRVARHRGVALAGTLVLVYPSQLVVVEGFAITMPILAVPAMLWQLDRWLRTGATAPLLCLTALLALSLHCYFPVREMLCALALTGGVLAVVHRLRGTLCSPERRPLLLLCIAACALVVIMLPKFIIAHDAAGNVVRLGRQVAVVVPLGATNAELLANAGALVNAIIFPSEWAGHVVPNYMVLFIPFALRRPYHPFLWLLLALLPLSLLGRNFLALLLLRFSPIATLVTHFHYFDHILLVITTAVGCHGCARWLGSLHSRHHPPSVWWLSLLILCATLWLNLACITRIDHTYPVVARGVPLLMTAACTALLACRAAPALAPGLARLMFLLPLFAAHLPVFATPVSCPATSRELYQPILPYRFINVRIDDGLPFARTCALTDRVALRGILTGTPSTHGAYWRTTMFDAWTADIPDSELPARLRVNQTLCYMVALPRSGHSSADTSFPHDISVSRFTPNELTLCVTTAKPALLIYADCWHPRWHVTIAGHEQPLLRYDGIFKCVVIPAGTSTVSFAFRHPAFTAALLAAHATLALLTILTLLAFVRQKRAIDNSTPPMYHRFIA